MAISRELIVTVKEDTAMLNEKIIVYENDKGIDLFFTIKENKYKYVKDNSMLKNIDNTFVNITVVKPDNTELTVPSYVENNKVRFTITQDLTDEFTEIGTYQLQFHITDNDCCEFTIPPISFEVKERLKGNKSDGVLEVGVAGKSTADNCKVSSELVLFEINGRYIKNVWENGDIITSAKLNNIEAGISANEEAIKSISTIKGDKGDKGDIGLTGAKGERGEKGIDGIQGSKGETGERGLQGVQGAKGDKGDRGLDGTPADLSAYATKDELKAKSDTTHNHNSEYASKSSEHTHSNKTSLDKINDSKMTSWDNKSNFDGNYNSLSNKPNIPTKTSQLANDNKFANEDFVTNKIAEASLGGGEVDLSGYATKDDLKSKADTTHSHSELHTHSNKSQLDSIDSNRMSTWDSKASGNHSHSYNDLTNKPDIPSISGLATVIYVDNGLSEKANSEHTHSKLSITDFAHRHDASEIDNLSSGDVSISGNNTFTGVNTFTNTMVVEKDDEVSKMMPSTASNACYYAFYKDKTNRSGYFGYESASTSNFVIANEANNADMTFKTKGSGKVKVNGNNILSSSDISSSTNSTSETSVASSNAVKIAYDKGAEALNTANTKANSSHTHTKANITDFGHRHNASDIDNLTIVSNASSVSYNKNECANVDIALDKLFTELNGQRVRGINISNKLLDMLI